MEVKSDNSQKLEALLFLAIEPQTAKKITSTLKISDKEFQLAFETLKVRLEKSGLDVIVIENKYELVVKPEYSDLLENIKENIEDRELSPAALEVLSIIIFKGPINKIDIEELRGINSGQTLRRLLISGLVTIQNQKQVRENDSSPIFEMTPKLLKHFGFTSKEECLKWIESKTNETKNTK